MCIQTKKFCQPKKTNTLLSFKNDPIGLSSLKVHHHTFILEVNIRDKIDRLAFMHSHSGAPAIEETLRAISKKLTDYVIIGLSAAAFEAWGYGVAIIKRIWPNYNEAENIREAQRLKATMPTPAELKEMIALA